MRAHRIGSKRSAGTVAAAFGGQGSLHGDGRWHHRGRLAVYAAQHASLAMLEVLVHLNQARAVQPYVRWEIEIPEDLVETPKSLPANWAGDIEVSRSYGDRWLEAKGMVALCIPSVIVPGEFNYLLNPAHPKFDLKWVVKGPEPVTFDQRLLTSKQ